MSGFDIVIEGGTVVDGTGAPAMPADVAIAAGRVAAIGELGAVASEDRIDARGRVVTPGFIDIHSHSDFSLLVDPGAGSALAQGVTSEVVGNCGHGCAPLGEPIDERTSANIYGWGSGHRELDWRTVAGYLDALGEARPAVNVATLVPFGALRLLGVGDVRRPAMRSELAVMRRELEAGLDDGAFGLSTGLEYPAESSAPTEEVEALVGIVARRERLYATHTRDRGRAVVESTGEAIQTARATGARTQVSHILARMGSGPDGADARIALALEEAVDSGIEIAWDVHTRRFGITNLSTALDGPPVESSALRIDAADAGVIASFGRAGWDRTFVLDGGDAYEELRDRSVADVAADRGQDIHELLLDVLRAAAAAGDVSRPMGIGMTYEESAIIDAIGTTRCAVGSDGTTMDLHSRLLPRLIPGAFSWAAWYLRRVVVETSALELPAAIARITSLPADQAGLRDRGRIVPGARADIAVFDPAAVREPADTIRPERLAIGMATVLVNGRIALEDGRPTGERAGEVLRA